MNPVIKVVVMGAFAAASFGVCAADVVSVASANVVWNASAIKKSVIELNVFANNDSLQFKYDPINSRFTNVGSSLTVQAGGKKDATAYGITAQLLRSKLTHLSGKTAGTLTVSSLVGGIEMDKAPVDILKGTKGSIELSAAGLQAMDLSTEGPVVAGNAKYHDATVAVDFRIEEGTDAKGAVVKLGAAGDAGLDGLAEGTYEGTVELAFVASWTSPEAPPAPPEE